MLLYRVVSKDHALGHFVRTDEAVKKSGLGVLGSAWGAENWCYSCLRRSVIKMSY